MNLSKYVAYGSFVNDIHNTDSIQSIIFESTNKTKEYSSSSDSEKNDDNSNDSNDKKNKTIMIAHKQAAKTIIDDMQAANDTKECIIIDCFNGIASQLHKIEQSTIEVAGRKTYDVYDQGQLLQLIDTQKKAIIRLYDKEYPTSLFEGHPLGKTGLIDMRPFGYTGESATVLGTAGYLSELTNAHFYKQQQKQETFNLFTINRYDFALTNEFLASCKTTNRVFFVIDSNQSDPYAEELSKELQREGIKNKDITIIRPEYENLSTIISDYMIEQTRFDALSIAERVAY